jgi:hypothetical protein
VLIFVGGGAGAGGFESLLINILRPVIGFIAALPLLGVVTTLGAMLGMMEAICLVDYSTSPMLFTILSSACVGLDCRVWSLVASLLL